MNFKSVLCASVSWPLFLVRYLRIRFVYGAVSASNFAVLYGPPFMQKMIARMYLRSDSSFEPAPLTDPWFKALSELRSDGFTVVSKLFDQSADVIAGSISLAELQYVRNDFAVIDWLVELGFSHPGVMDVLADRNLCALLTNYYGRSFCYRDRPVITSHSSAMSPRSSEHVHVDGYRQITCFLMLSNMDEASSQLVVARGSHAKLKFDLSRSQAREVPDADFVPVVAEKGDLVIFDSGAMWHYGVSRDNPRHIMSFIATTGWLRANSGGLNESDYLNWRLKNEDGFVKGAFSQFD